MLTEKKGYRKNIGRIKERTSPQLPETSPMIMEMEITTGQQQLRHFLLSRRSPALMCSCKGYYWMNLQAFVNIALSCRTFYISITSYENVLRAPEEKMYTQYSTSRTRCDTSRSRVVTIYARATLGTNQPRGTLLHHPPTIVTNTKLTAIARKGSTSGACLSSDRTHS